MAHRRKKILVVDDSRSFLTYITVLLKKMGFFKINLAASGQEAIKLLNIWMPDIIIMGIKIPALDSVATLRSLKKDPRTHNVPVIMLMASKDPEAEKECREIGASQVLVKPVAISTLNNAIQECLAQSGLNRRIHLRSRFTGKVDLLHMGKKRTLEARTLSEGGIFLHTSNTLAVSEKAGIKLRAEETLYCLKGEVFYHMSESSSPPEMGQGMALRFLDVEPDIAGKLKAFVVELLSGNKKTPPG